MVLRTFVNKLKDIYGNPVIFISCTVGHAVCWPVGTPCCLRLLCICLHGASSPALEVVNVHGVLWEYHFEDAK